MKAAVYGQACNTYPDCEIVHVYAEEEFQRMLEDAKSGRFDMIIAESVFPVFGRCLRTAEDNT